MALPRPARRRLAVSFGFLSALLGVPAGIAPAVAREVVTASAPHAVAVTIYRDPDRGPDDSLDRDFPRGFALITERRRVTLPKGEVTLRFDGVTEGMVAVSALVTGLPHKVEEQNRNAALLSPASLIDGSFGNRVNVTHTNPATGIQTTENAVLRTRADGGLVVQTASGFEALRCAGLPEKITFDNVPDGLSAQPVYSLATQGDGGTHEVQLTYLSWGFDWQAHHVVRVHDKKPSDDPRFGLVSWLTLVNSNGQNFADAELSVVAGTLNVDSDYANLASVPEVEPLYVTCFPLGSTTDPRPMAVEPPVLVTLEPSPPPLFVMMAPASRSALADAPLPMVAVEEALGDLKLFRVPEPVTVAAKSQKQVAFLLRDQASGKLVYETHCAPWQTAANPVAMRLLLESVNDARHGLDASLPLGGVTVFEGGPGGDLLLAEDTLKDTPKGQSVALELGGSTTVQAACVATRNQAGNQYSLRAVLTNAKDEAVQTRVVLGIPSAWRISGLKDTRLKDGQTVYETTVPARSSRTLTWQITAPDQK